MDFLEVGKWFESVIYSLKELIFKDKILDQMGKEFQDSVVFLVYFKQYYVRNFMDKISF